MVLQSHATEMAQWRKRKAAKEKPIKNWLTKLNSRSRLSSRSKSRSNPHRTKSGSRSPSQQAPSQQAQRPHALPTVSGSGPTALSQENHCPNSQHIRLPNPLK
eukprot:scaffold79856_cov24-Cyclotella_meneghiniana.AAC.1